jgi:hypothetical protein
VQLILHPLFFYAHFFTKFNTIIKRRAMKPKFRIINMLPHPTCGTRILLDPINHVAYNLIRDRDAGKISDFPLVIYQETKN